MSTIVTGAGGFLGGHVLRLLKAKNVQHVLPDDRAVTAKSGDAVIHLAAMCGGIGFNKANNVDMMTENLRIGLSAFDRFKDAGKHVYVSTTCMYPEMCPTPFNERDIWRGRPETTNAPYGIAKRAISELFRLMGATVLIPANLYGPGDHFEPERSHVIPAMIRKLVEAKDAGKPAVEFAGSGTATRDFLYVGDCAAAVVKVATMPQQPAGFFNLGTGEETSIHELAHLVADVVGYEGEIYFAEDGEDGQPRRSINAGKAGSEFLWKAGMGLEAGIIETVKWYRCQRR